jgi:hypothetical protein
MTTWQPWIVDGRKPPTAAVNWQGEAMRRSPSHAPTMQGDVAVPVAQSIITGLLLGGPVGAVLVYVTQLPWYAALCAVCAVMACAWLVLLVDHRRLLWGIERITHTDIDGDREVGPPEELRVELSHTDAVGNYHAQILSIPGIEADRLRQFAAAVTSGKGLAVNAWTGSGALFTRSEYDRLLAELQRAGLAAKGAGVSGWALTRPGRAVLAEVARR